MFLSNTSVKLISSVSTLIVAAATAVNWQPPAEEPQQPQQPRQEQPRVPWTEPPPPPPRSAIHPHALAIVQRVSEHIERSDSFTSRITYSFEVRGPVPEGQVTQMLTQELAFQRPNLMRLEVVEGAEGETMLSDGGALFIHLPKRNRYLEQSAPGDLRGLMEHPGAMVGAPGGLGGPLSFLGMILVPEMFEGLAPLIQGAAYIGTEELDERPVHRIMLAIALPDATRELEPPNGVDAPGKQTEPIRRSSMIEGASRQIPSDPPPGLGDGMAVPPTPLPELVLDLWIEEREDSAVLRRMRIDIARLLKAHDAIPEDLKDFSIDVWVHMTDWRFDDDIPEETFTFEPPEGAQRVETLRDMIAIDASPRKHELIGQQAPSFHLQRLVGTMLELNEHIGRDIVVLDFWASWCTPCVRAIPHLLDIADEFRGQNVVFYFVNLREDFDRVQSFIEDRGWEGRMMIPMDIEGDVAQFYGVTSIPQTVIIDREGIIQAVHIGFSPGMEERLRSEVQTLLDGESLIEAESENENNENNEDDEDDANGADE